MKKINLSHRAAFLVLLLVFTVALTTALVLAGERSRGSGKKSGNVGAASHGISAQMKAERSACETA